MSNTKMAKGNKRKCPFFFYQKFLFALGLSLKPIYEILTSAIQKIIIKKKS